MNVKSALILTGTLAFIISSCAAQAGEYKRLPSTGAHANAGAIALGGNASLYSNIGIRNGANSSADIEFNDKLQIPNAPGLSSGSSNTTAEHYKYKQRQVSTFFGGWTNIDMELDIIGFLKYYGSITDENTRKAFNLAACIESDKWRKLRQQQGEECAK